MATKTHYVQDNPFTIHYFYKITELLFNQNCVSLLYQWKKLKYLEKINQQILLSYKVVSSTLKCAGSNLTNTSTVIEMKIWIYWTEKQILEFISYTYLNKNWKIYWSEQSFTVLRPEDRFSSWGLLQCRLAPTT